MAKMKVIPPKYSRDPYEIHRKWTLKLYRITDEYHKLPRRAMYVHTYFGVWKV